MLTASDNSFHEKQVLAISLLARKDIDNMSITEVAEIVGVSRKTLYEWLKDSKFKREINKKALQALADYSPLVLKSAEEFLKSKNEQIKLKGVELVMKSVEAQKMKKMHIKNN